MDIKLKNTIPSHYLNPTPAPSTLKQIAYSKDKKITYELEGIYEKKCKNRLRLAIKVFALTFFTFGFALISEKMRENLQSVWTGKKKIIVYLRKKEIIEAKPEAKPEEVEIPKPVEKTIQVSSILKDDPKPIPKDPIKEKYDELIKQHKNESYIDWFRSIKKEIEKDSKLSLKDFFLHLCKNDEAQKLINNKTLEDLTKCRKIVFTNQEKEIECLGLDCELLKLNTNFFESMWKESGYREADTNTPSHLNEVDFETFQNMLKILRDVSYLDELDINQIIDLCNLSEYFHFKENNPIRKHLEDRIQSHLLDPETEPTKDLDLEHFKHLYGLVNKNHESSDLKDKFVQRLIDSLKNQEHNERTLSIKKLRKDFDPMLILNIYASWRGQIGFSPFESEDVEKHLDLTFFCELYKSALVMQWGDLQRHFLDGIAALLEDSKNTDDEYKKSIDTLEPSILVGLFEINRLKIEHLTEQKLAALRENYRQKQSEKGDNQIKIDTIRHLCECFPRYQPRDVDSQFEKLSTLIENIQRVFPEITPDTLDSLQHSIRPYLPTILYLQKALEVLNSEMDDKQKTFNELIQSIKNLSGSYSSQSDRVFFITSLANLAKTETLHLSLKIRGNFETDQFITQILESNDKDKIQIVFREYFAQAEDLYGSALILSRSDRYMKEFKVENHFVYTSPHFLKILQSINSSEKLEWILETIPQNELKEIFVECLRKGVIIEKNYTSKTYRIGLSTKETEETFTRLGY